MEVLLNLVKKKKSSVAVGELPRVADCRRVSWKREKGCGGRCLSTMDDITPLGEAGERRRAERSRCGDTGGNAFAVLLVSLPLSFCCFLLSVSLRWSAH
jgi:hypothetical protein